MYRSTIKSLLVCSLIGLANIGIAEEYETECGGYDPDGKYVFCDSDSDSDSSIIDDVKKAWGDVQTATDTDTWTDE